MVQRRPVSPVATVPQTRLRLGVTNLSVPYLASTSIDTADARIRRAVVVLHDHHRDTAETLGHVTVAAAAAGIADETIVVAPQFLTEADVGVHSPGTGVAHWSGGWKQGDHSVLAPGRVPSETVSSFAVVDVILATLANTRTFPGLRLTVVAGHSAGGSSCSATRQRARADQHPVRDREPLVLPLPR